MFRELLRGGLVAKVKFKEFLKIWNIPKKFHFPLPCRGKDLIYRGTS